MRTEENKAVVLLGVSLICVLYFLSCKDLSNAPHNLKAMSVSALLLVIIKTTRINAAMVFIRSVIAIGCDGVNAVGICLMNFMIIST